MFDSYKGFEINEHDIAILLSEKALLESVENYIAANGALKESLDVSAKATLLVSELLSKIVKRETIWNRLRTWICNLFEYKIRAAEPPMKLTNGDGADQAQDDKPEMPSGNAIE